MKRILVLSNSFSGLHNFRKELLKTYRDMGYDVYISCPIGNDGEKVKWFENIGCKIIDTQFNRQGINPIDDIKLLFTYRNIIKQLKPIVVLSYTIKPNLYGGMACNLCRVPQIVNITGLGTAVEYPSLLQKITILLYKIGLKKAKVVFFQNDANRQFCLKHKMVKGYTRLIPGSGVNLEYHLKKEYPHQTDPIRFIFISRIRKEKGIEEYLAAAEFIKKKYPYTEFHILGGCEGDYKNRLELLNNNGIVVYHGLQSDVRPFIANTHCTIHPSFYPEGMSNVLLESCAAGRPIITTDRPGCKEIVDNEINGYIVKQQDSADLIEKVEKFISLSHEQKHKMGLAARRKVEREFNRQIVVDAYIEETEKLIR